MTHFFLLSFLVFADLLTYTDKNGKVFYVDNISKIPGEYKSSAKEVGGKITILEASKATYSNLPPVKRYANGVSKVELLVTPTCPYCKKAEDFLKSKHVTYTKYDITSNAKGMALYKELNGSGVPILRIGSKVIRGFDEQAIQNALKR